MSSSSLRVLVLGAGVIGLSVADELVRRGHRVQVVDPAPGSGASHAAAGMLSPSSEVWHGEAEILRLGLESVRLWPPYAARLGVSLHRTGTLLVGHDRADLQHVERQVALLADGGQDVDLLGGRDARRREPTLSARVAGGAWLADDHSVDPRALVAALVSCVGRPAERLPGRSVRRTSPLASCEVVAGTRGAQDVPEAGEYDVTVLATGARLPEPWTHLVRGVRGEVVRLHAEDLPGRTVRGWVRDRPVYLVPRPGGEVVVGATAEEHDAAPEATAGGVFALLEAARALVPGIDRARFGEAIARDRPGTADNLPLVGPAPGRDDAVLAAGFFRHGVLLAPLAAHLAADCVERGAAAVRPELDPRRFDDVAESARVDVRGRRVGTC